MLLDCQTRARMNQCRYQLCQGQQHKVPLSYARMGHLQTHIIQQPIGIKKQVNIQGARCPPLAATASSPVFNGQTNIQQLAWSKAGGYFHHGIQIVGLTLWSADGGRLVQGRGSSLRNSRVREKLLPCTQECRTDLTQIRAKAQKCPVGDRLIHCPRI